MKEKKQLIVQPRMGFSSLNKMSEGLNAVKNANATTIGTITLDSYTRTAQHLKAKKAIELNEDLNGFPIIDHCEDLTKNMLNLHLSENFPIQVRHGTPLPSKIFESLLKFNIDATEGGPISYCLPYSRVPLNLAIEDWKKSCQIFSSSKNKCNHIESFGGCMLGQLCPPSLLIALGIIECLFFKENGIKSVSLSYCQGTNTNQDINAISAMRILAKEYLSDMFWHVVVYSYMGVFPKTTLGSFKLMRESVRLAILSKSERLIVKTPLESKRIPLIAENIASLELSNFYANEFKHIQMGNIQNEEADKIYGEAKFLIDLILNENNNLSDGILSGFKKGYLDVPYCLHNDNKNRTKCFIDENGFLQWDNIGNIPFPNSVFKAQNKKKSEISSTSFLKMLSYVQNKYDNF